MPANRFVDKVLYVKLPDSKGLRWRWIVRKREDGRYIVRAPKIGVLVRELDLKRDSDYGKETLLPIGSVIEPSSGGKSRRRTYKLW
jgi:hypothetical protein